MKIQINDITSVNIIMMYKTCKADIQKVTRKGNIRKKTDLVRRISSSLKYKT